jgi:hypothetical protein
MMMNLLADVAPAADSMISGSVVVGIIGAITTLVVGVIGKLKIDQVKGETSREVTIKRPVPTVNIKEDPEYATKGELHEVWVAIEANRQANHEELSKIYNRLNTQSGVVATLQGTMNEVKNTVNQLLVIAINGKSPGK